MRTFSGGRFRRRRLQNRPSEVDRAYEPDAGGRETPALAGRGVGPRAARCSPCGASRTGQPLAGGGQGSLTPSHPHPCEGQRQLSAKCPPFGPVFPPIEHDRPKHGLTARTADRAVLYDFRRFLAGIHAILETPVQHAVIRGRHGRGRQPPTFSFKADGVGYRIPGPEGAGTLRSIR